MFDRFVPDLRTLALVTPTALLYVVFAAGLVGWLRRSRGLRAPDTRKIFHFLIISAALAIQLLAGPSGTAVFGVVVAAAVVYAVSRGTTSAFYDAIARPTDAPHASLFVIVPLATTALGGVLANVFFPAWAHVGYFVVGWGDAVGEPVGTRWGRHPYRVRSLAGVPATRSLEGSAAVLIASTIAAFVALRVSGVTAGTAALSAAVIGAASAIVEAISSHGIDNLTVQLTATAVAALLLA